MRKFAKAILLVIISLIASIGIVIGSAFSAALAFGATALIVPGTGTHNINPPMAVQGYKEKAANRYINPSGVGCTSPGTCNLVGVDYPASFFPLAFIPGWCPGLTCDTWNQSVGTGVANLNAAVIDQRANPTPNNQDLIIFGYSQGGAVVSQELYNLAGLTPEQKSHISVVTIGNINNPQGLFSRFSFLPTIPFLDISFGPQLPTNIGIKSTNYSFEYDPVGDAPLYWGNPLAVANALAAFEYVHGYYLAPNTNGPDETLPYGYSSDPANDTLAAAIATAPKRTYGDATFVLIPQQGTLPLLQPFVDLAAATGLSPLINPIVALISPTLKVLINLGYDRTINPGIPQTLSILPFSPFTNPITVGVDLVGAVLQGIQNALGGGAAPMPALAPATTPVTNSVVAARFIAPQKDVETATELDGNATVTALSSKSERLTGPVDQPLKIDTPPATNLPTAPVTPAAIVPASTPTPTPVVSEVVSTTGSTVTGETTPNASGPTVGTDDAKKDDSTKNDSAKKDDSAKRDDSAKKDDSTKNDSAKKDDSTKNDSAKKDDSTKNDSAKNDSAKKDDSAKNDSAKNDSAKKDDSTKNDSAKKDAA